MSNNSTLNPLLQLQLEIILVPVRDIQLTRFALFCSATIWFYDYLLTIQDEITFIWRIPFSFIKAQFVVLRYMNMVSVITYVYAIMSPHITDHFCQTYIQWETWGLGTLLVICEGVLLLWTVIIFNQNRYLLMGLGALLLGESIALIDIIVRTNRQIKAHSHYIPGLPFCSFTNEGFILSYYWVPVLVYHAVLLALFLYKGWDVYISRSKASKGLLARIFRSCLVNFLAIFASYLACAVMWLKGDPLQAQIPVGFAMTFTSINVSRLLLNIRRAHHEYGVSRSAAEGLSEGGGNDEDDIDPKLSTTPQYSLTSRGSVRYPTPQKFVSATRTPSPDTPSTVAGLPASMWAAPSEDTLSIPSPSVSLPLTATGRRLQMLPLSPVPIHYADDDVEEGGIQETVRHPYQAAY